MNQTVYEMLKRVARSGTLVAYTDVAKLIGLDMENPDHRTQMSILLDDISSHEHHHDRPLLSAVVIRKDLGRPGHGFYELAGRLGLYHGDREIDEVVFFAKEFRRVEECWRNRPA